MSHQDGPGQTWEKARVERRHQRERGEHESALLKNTRGRALAAMYGIESFDSSDSPAREDRKPPTAEEQFDEARRNLTVDLRKSRILPDHVTRRWIEKLERIDVYRPSEGLTAVNALLTDHSNSYTAYKPQVDVFDLSGMGSYYTEKVEIKGHLDWIATILKHVEAHLRENRR